MANFKKTLLTTVALLGLSTSLTAQNTPSSQMEKLDRGLVALPVSSGSGNFVSWRFFGTDDPEHTTFDLLCNGNIIARNLTVTNYKHTSGNSSSTYQVVCKVDGETVETSKEVKAWDKVWLKLPLDRPAQGAQGGTYTPNDCSVGDVDGDGEYEIFVKWDPSNSKDNSQDGITDNVLIDCYKLNGTKLWRIDLGHNIRAGAHYTQFMVYDFDGDGKVEMMCKTAPGSKDSEGTFVNQATDNATIKGADNTKSWITSSGRMDGGHEYLSVFDGATGKVVNTIAYNPNRNNTSTLSEAQGTFNWAEGKTDTHGYNRGDRYLAAVAYLDGPQGKASAIFCRGYYSYANVWAVDYDGTKLIPRWLHRSASRTSYNVVYYDANGGATGKSFTANAATGQTSGSRTMFANGNHNLTIGDVDGDGCDEIIWGSAALDHDGTLLYATGFGHGDAIHMGKMIPGREGMQVFQVHEEKGTYAWDLHDAATGEVLWKGGPAGVDNGRGMAAQLSVNTKDWWFSSASEREQRSAATGEVASSANGSTNFRMYWDGTLQDALLDGNTLDKYNDNSKSFGRLVTFYNLGPGSTCNSTKKTPNLSGDILGDWREELILFSATDAETYLGIYSTNIETPYTVPTLMHDHTYRMAICWQNTAYNQPPHLGYNLAEAMAPQWSEPAEITVQVGEEMSHTFKAKNTKALRTAGGSSPDGTKSSISIPSCFTSSKETLGTSMTLTLTGTPNQEGDYQVFVKLTDMNGTVVNDTITIHVVNATGIRTYQTDTPSATTEVFDLSGQKMHGNASTLKGVRIIRTTTPDGRTTTHKVIQ